MMTGKNAIELNSRTNLMNQPLKSPSPDKKNRNIIQPTQSPDSMAIQKICTPTKNTKKYFQNNEVKETHMSSNRIDTRNIENDQTNEPQQQFKSGSNAEGAEYKLAESREISQRIDLKHYLNVISEKEEIIMELKHIIKMINDNQKARPTTSTDFYRSADHQRPQKEGREELINRLKDQVKVLTIQNSYLIDIINKTSPKQQETAAKTSKKPITHHSTEQNYFSSWKINENQKQVEGLQIKLQKVESILEQKQREYDKEINEWIKSHKSLAVMCEAYEREKKNVETENQRLIKLLKEREESIKLSSKIDQDKFAVKSAPNEKFIQRIKDQYHQSQRQFQENMTIEVQNMFEIVRTGMEDLNRKVQYSEQKVLNLEKLLSTHHFEAKQPQKTIKKSEIYIEEGVSSSVSSDEQKKKPNQENGSRFLEDLSFSNKHYKENDELKEYQAEIERLQAIITELQSEKEAREESYTFRQKQIEELQFYKVNLRQKERQMNSFSKLREEECRQSTKQVNMMRKQMDRLQVEHNQQLRLLSQEKSLSLSVLKEQKNALLNKMHYYQQQLQELTSIHQETHLYQHQNRKLCQKIEEFQKLFFVLRSEMEEKIVNEELFSEMKRKLMSFQDKWQEEKKMLTDLVAENKILVIANNQLTTANNQFQRIFEQKVHLCQHHEKCIEMLNQNIQKLQLQKDEFENKYLFSQNALKNSEIHLEVKKQSEIKLLAEKQLLEKQIIGYLSLFNKIEQKKILKKQNEEQDENLEWSFLLKSFEALETSVIKQTASQRESKENILKFIETSKIETKNFHLANTD